MRRLSGFLVIVSMLVALTFISASSSFAFEVDADLAKLSESPGSAAANLALIRKAVQRINREQTGHLVFPQGVFE